MFFQRFWSTAAVRSGLRAFGSRAATLCVFLLALTATEAVFAQISSYRSLGTRRVWNVDVAAPTGIPSRISDEDAATSGGDVAARRPSVQAGIPSRVETPSDASDETGWAKSGNGEAGNRRARSDENATNRPNGQVGQNVRPARTVDTAPSVSVSLPFARKATREQLER
ncbi:MAG: hypothetical protein IKU86_06715, partial [Thermoguttaceae bacterium]|nr:hypothetical protein [Thermoguttaceae bacterium]